jgi:type VI protein secretion system component VasK
MNVIIAAVTAVATAIAEFFKWRSADAENKPDKDRAETLERSARSLEEAQARNREAQRELDRQLKDEPQKRHLGDDW